MPWTEVLLGALAGGLALFVWNAVCWMALPHHHADFRPLANEEDLSYALGRAGVKPGVYMLPHMENYKGGMKDPALDARWKKGPNVTVTVMPAGPCMMGSAFLKGYGLTVLEAFAGAVILHWTAGSLGSLPRTLGFFAGLGALVNGARPLSQVIWMKYPLRNAMTLVFDGVVGYALMGLVLHFVMPAAS